ncbi:MAG: helicase-associated domain-containing protein [bacterium]
MKYIECISHLQIEDLRKIIEVNNIKCSSPSRAVIMKQILAHFTDREFLKRLLNRFEPIERTALALLIFFSDKDGVESTRYDLSIGRLRKGRGKRVKEIIESLIQSGLVFIRDLNYYRQAYFIPDDLKSLLVEPLMEGVADRLKTVETEPPFTVDDGLALERDIFTFLAHVKRGGVRLTQAGEIFKRRKENILADFERKEDIRTIYYHYPTYPTRFGFILDFCTCQGLIEIDSSVMVTTEKVTDWLKLGTIERMRRIAHHYLTSTYLHSDWGGLIFNIISQVKGGGWIKIEALDKEVSALFGDGFYGISEMMRLFLLNFILFLGVVALGGPGPDNFTVVRATALGRAVLKREEQGFSAPVERSFSLQPNYEVLVPRNIDPLIRWELEEIAVSEKTDQMMVYRISRDSIHQAFKHGRTEEDIISFLSRHTKQRLPQNVEYSIRDWAREYGRIYFLNAFLLRCDSDSLAGQIKGSKKIGPFIKGEITPKDLIINGRDYPKLVEALEKEGYMPRAGVERV